MIYGGTPILGKTSKMFNSPSTIELLRKLAKDCQRLCSYELRARGQTLRFGHLHMELPLVFQFLHRGRHLKRSQRDPRLVGMEDRCSYKYHNILSGFLHILTACICTSALYLPCRSRPLSNNEKTNSVRFAQEERDQ